MTYIYILEYFIQYYNYSDLFLIMVMVRTMMRMMKILKNTFNFFCQYECLPCQYKKKYMTPECVVQNNIQVKSNVKQIKEANIIRMQG